MKDFLNEIVAYKKELLAQKKDLLLSLKHKLSQTSYTRYKIFYNSIAKKGQINLIAEIKKASPSQGLIRDHFDVLSIARTYELNGAAAISVLTEDKYFLGQMQYLRKLAEHVRLPLLMKDFVIDELQLYEAKLAGASAILLIVAILSDEQLKAFMQTADELDLDCLVEVHDVGELNRALSCGADIIGINNRNLHSFEVDLTTSEKLIPLIPAEKVIVAESGLTSYEQVHKLEKFGAHAVLIGETFMREYDIAAKIHEVMHGTKR